MEKEIGKINKNDTTDIVVRIDDFGGVNGLTIREFVTSDRYTGFTKSGVRIQSKDFVKFKEMINSIDEADLAETPNEPSEPTESTPAETAPGQETLEAEKEKSGEKKEEMPDY